MLRLLLSPRWLVRHAVMVLLVAAFLALGWWQLKRGEAGNARSFAYALEWPLFAAFVVAMWAKMIHEEVRPPKEDARAGHTGGEEGADGEVLPIRRVPQPPEEEQDEELAAYNAYLARLNEQARRRGR